MQPTLFPVTTIACFFLAQALDTTSPQSFIEIAAQYGPLGLIALALGAFAFWQERKRDKREDESRKERLAHLAALTEIISQKDRIIAEKDAFILEQAKGN